MSTDFCSKFHGWAAVGLSRKLESRQEWDGKHAVVLIQEDIRFYQIGSKFMKQNAPRMLRRNTKGVPPKFLSH